MAWSYFYKDVLPFAAMVTVECTNVGLNTLFKAAFLKGMSYYVFTVYSYALATLLLLPVVPFILHSSPVLPSAKFPLFSRICILALVGFLAHIVGNKGIEYSSPTLSSAMSNLTPAFTFIFAIIFRLERLTLRNLSTEAKIIGTIVSISGALVVVLCKGPTILPTMSRKPTILLHWPLSSQQSDWFLGGILLASQCLLYSIWYILQLVVTFFYTLSVTIICAPVCFIAEKNLDAWRLRPGIALTAILYSAFFGPCFSTVVHSWGLHLKGPVYIAMFKPLSIAIAELSWVSYSLEMLFISEALGFYAVTWGKASEEKTKDEASTGKVSLLQSTSEHA